MLRLLAVGVAYYVTARLGLELAIVGDSVTPLWPPTGLAVVALLAGGYRVWPAIAAAAFAVNLPISPSAGTAAAIAVGNTVAPLAAAWLLNAASFQRDLVRLRDAVVLLGTALVSMTISASVGTVALFVSDAVPGFGWGDTWWVWWTGDAMGVLLVAPFLWSLRHLSWRTPDWRRVAEAGALFAVLAAVAVLVSHADDPILFVVLPLLVWFAWRYQQRGAAPAGLLVSVVVILAAVHDRGIFEGLTVLEKMYVLQAFNAVVSFTAFFFAAAVAERRQAFEYVYEREHRVAETLQRSLLPEQLPQIPGLAVCARYIPASRDVEIGGDWYDVFSLRQGRLALVVGDVAGHGVTAAAAMTQLRMALRAEAAATEGPTQALERLNRLIAEFYPDLMATALYAVFDPATAAVRFARAGHPPPLAVTADGEARYLNGGLGPPLGVFPSTTYIEASCRIDTGGGLFLFTDGLVERRDQGLEPRLELLRTLARHAHSDLDAACDNIIGTLLSDGVVDDVALLALRPMSLAGEPLRLDLPARASEVPDARHLLARWLAENGATAQVISDVLVASTEAHTNAVQHAYRHGYGTVQIEATIDHPDVVITVRDHGTWRTPPASQHRAGGRGLVLIRAVMDATEFHTNSDGTEVRMRRRFVRDR